MRNYFRWIVIALMCAFLLAAHLGLAAESGARRSAADALPSAALKGSTSAYPELTAESPVRWQPWSEKTLALARFLRRPLLIDIGAAWCHACDVMDETSYHDREVVKLINKYFVPIRVDGDERPGIDAYYHRAAEVADVGGIPLTCFARSVVAVVGSAADPRTHALLEAAERPCRPFKVVIAVDPSAPAGALPPAARPYFAATVTQKASPAFVCAGRVCATPTDDPARLAATIKTLRAAYNREQRAAAAR